MTNSAPQQAQPVTLDDYQLDDRYKRTSGQIFLTGTQALVRIPLLQAEADKKAGLNTAGFISGYRGSPLGNYDRELWTCGATLKEHNITFTPGINEELAATAVLGSQQVETSGHADYDGVFGIWYGKGPGADRASDALKHANSFGASPHGGVLVVAGDDHGAVSSSMNHQSEQLMESWMMPVLAPSNLLDYLNFGLYGFALSRYSGCWSGFIAVSEVVESAATVNMDLVNDSFVFPPHEGYDKNALHYRWPDPFPQIEGRLIDHKLKAVHAFARANPLEQVIWDGDKPAGDARKPLGIVTCGKAYLDLMEALAKAGIDKDTAEKAGLSIFKIGLTWPIEPEGVTAFCRQFDRIVVVEEKRSFVERQIRDLFYNMPAENRPVIVGKNREDGTQMLNPVGEISPEDVLAALTPYLQGIGLNHTLDQLNNAVVEKIDSLKTFEHKDFRTPYFCSGCPHNTSTKVPDGSRAMLGIGCHFMANGMDRNSGQLTQMGGEGVNWIGQSQFTHEGHIFQNLGDGTYYHSGLLAIRQAVAAKVNITYKILYNDAIAMTGGQPLEGTLLPDQISRQLHNEGVRAIYVVTDEPEKYKGVAHFAPGVTIHHRDELDDVQRKLREVKGVSALIYDQTCASEKRRRRKKKQFPDPPKRAFINQAVCEGCGDCSVASNCVSIMPQETELGRKRMIDQSSCNKDYSCINGFCPSFVTVHGGSVKKGAKTSSDSFLDQVPMPTLPAMDQGYDIMVTGIGGTGIVTIGQIMVMAAHLEGKGATVLDFTGFAQKGGSVISYLRLAPHADDIKAVRIGTGEADLLLGCDMVVAGSPESLRTLQEKKSSVILNTQKIQTAQFTLNRDADIHDDLITRNIRRVVGEDALNTVDATRLATALMGDSIATNMFLFGYAWQQGTVPLSLDAIYRAIELNGVAIDSNKQSFSWGRIAAHDVKMIEQALPHPLSQDAPFTELEDIVNYRATFLKEYQDQALANKYLSTVETIRALEDKVGGSDHTLTKAVARNYFKLLAIKDEYEVARLYTNGDFERRLNQQFEGDFKIHFHMAPPLIAPKDSKGHLRKMEFGGWMHKALKVVARLRSLRGTAFDVFGRTEERKMERRLISDYEDLMALFVDSLTSEKLSSAIALAEIPEDIRGYGHVKEKSVELATQKSALLLQEYHSRDKHKEVA
ncbi:indolepyruvate ferredoxin oxidoreductase family protein [Paremcibacter congregatus]|uniref:indolepyruvate ferredoxin oxidoreductase family protein n=1 Tax=Paremcibacter congregatus TaxID=2043170 RepID=UPI0030EC5818|tara:strand:+ start:743 stop:4252 length:3510 start_codon:yes stop_codon:yes gene_type:complete